MGRTSELTQDLVSDAADQLTASGKKPSPNTIRGILNTGSFSTIKLMLDIWAEKQDQEDKIPVPEMPEFAHKLLEKLHRELYIQNHKTLEGERQILDATRHEFETERKEMFNEIGSLEEQKSGYIKSLEIAQSALKDSVAKLEESNNKINSQNIDMATAIEREHQLKVQIDEKVNLLKQSEIRETALQKTIFELSKNK